MQQAKTNAKREPPKTLRTTWKRCLRHLKWCLNGRKCPPHLVIYRVLKERIVHESHNSSTLAVHTHMNWKNFRWLIRRKRKRAQVWFFTLCNRHKRKHLDSQINRKQEILTGDSAHHSHLLSFHDLVI